MRDSFYQQEISREITSEAKATRANNRVGVVRLSNKITLWLIKEDERKEGKNGREEVLHLFCIQQKSLALMIYA